MVKFGAIALIVVPIVKITMTLKNNCLVVNPCTNKAEIVMTIPLTSMTPITIHGTVCNVMSISVINVVKAIFINVSFNTTKDAPIMSESIIGNVFTLGSSAKYSYFFVDVSSIKKPLSIYNDYRFYT